MERGTCSWLIEVASGNPEPDFPSDLWKIVECGAPTVVDDRGWRCEAGHEYTNMETRWREGWDYDD